MPHTGNLIEVVLRIDQWLLALEPDSFHHRDRTAAVMKTQATRVVDKHNRVLCIPAMQPKAM